MAITRRRVLLGALGAAGLGAVGDALLETGWLETTRHQVPLPGLPGHLDGLTIAQISDVHRGGLVGERAIARAVAACASLGADVVVVTGDFVSGSSAYAPSCARLLAQLRAPRGLFAVAGNHDHWHGLEVVMGALRREGIEDLSNAGTRLAPGLWLAGVDDLWAGKPDLERSLRGRRPEEGVVLLSHSPRILPVAARRGLRALCLSGHTHGGQVRLPLVRPRWVPALQGLPYWAGWYSRAGARLYVNRGIGVVGLPVRFRCRPEISLFTLRAPESRLDTSPLPCYTSRERTGREDVTASGGSIPV